jgi:predicted RNA binding protein YcfA (HicA-like mRNA interferase family)
MGKFEKLLLQILRGTADANVSFDDLCQLLRRFGFEERTRGSHHTFRKQGKAWTRRSTCSVRVVKRKFIKYDR